MMYAHDNSGRPPRLETFQASWAMMDLPGAQGQFDLRRALDWTKANGFGGLMYWAQTSADMANLDVIRKGGLLPGVGIAAQGLDESCDLINAAAAHGATFLNAQVYDAFLPEAEVLKKLEALYAASDRAGVPMYIETHRGRVTQDLLRTVYYADYLRRMTFTLDASHYVLAGEINSPDDDAQFTQLLARLVNQTGAVHARVSNGEQVQVDIGDGSAAVAQPFIRWWTVAYMQWRERAAAGDIFPFVCELGPRPYAIAAPTGEELGDRLAQALVFKRIAEQIGTCLNWT